MSDLPDCPMCGIKADPRFWAAGVMFCDGCWPDPNGGEWIKTRALHAVAAQARAEALAARVATLTAERDGLSEMVSELEADLGRVAAERDAALAQLASARADERRRCWRLVNAALQSEVVCRDRAVDCGRTEIASRRQPVIDALRRALDSIDREVRPTGTEDPTT